jgi:transcription antitermination protein NusB
VSGRTETGRHRAREVLFRLAYQCDLTHDSIATAWRARGEEVHLTPDADELVGDVVGVLDSRAADVDGAITAAAKHWPLARLAVTDRAVLRSAVAELLGRPGTPARVVLDEAIELAKRYGSEESGRFVNGVLDQVARQLRPDEFA